MTPIRLEVIAPLVSGVKHCRHCQPFLDDAGVAEKIQQEEMNSFPEEAWHDYTRLSRMVRGLAASYGAGLRIVLIDPRTPMGLLKSIRYWVRSYPAFILNGRAKYIGWDLQAVERLLREAHAAPAGGIAGDRRDEVPQT